MLRFDYLITATALAAALAIGTAQAAHASGSGPAYEAAIAELSDMHQSCAAMGGTMVYDDGHLVEMLFSHDGVPDYVVDARKATCDGALSLFCGSGGCSISAFASEGTFARTGSFNLSDVQVLETSVRYRCPAGGTGQMVFTDGGFILTGC